MHSLPQRLFDHIRRNELLHAGDRVGVAVSGGIDSVALARLMLELRQELGIILSVVHFNHKLRGADSEKDQEFVADLARQYGLEFLGESGDTAGLAAEEHSGLEAAARELRYGYFYRLLGVDGIPECTSAAEAEAASHSAPALDKIVTGHTLDDQAETVLMRLIRGTGLRGLGGIHPRILFERADGESHGEIVRPLLGIRRHELEQYLRELNQPWREDATNSDEKFTRNRVRRVLLPLIEKEFNRNVAENLAELAEIARDEEDYWENEVAGWLSTVAQWTEEELAGSAVSGGSGLVQIGPLVPGLAQDDNRLGSDRPGAGNATLSRPWLLTEPKAVQRRVVKAIGDEAGIPLEFKHIEEILQFAHDTPSGKKLSLPLGWKVARDQETIVFLTPDLHKNKSAVDYEYRLPVPGMVFVCEIGAWVEAVCVAPESRSAEYNPQQLLRADRLQQELVVRNWRPGDKFWPAHTKEPKKVKELLQEKHLNQASRKRWPVLLSGDQLVWMRGFPVPANLRAGTGDHAVLIREVTPVTEPR